jgi:transposase, IS5 family
MTMTHTLSRALGAEQQRRTTHRTQFLIQMKQIIPWTNFCALIEPHCHEGLMSAPTMRIERMLRIYFLQQWFGLSDAAAEESLIDSVAMREFAGIDGHRDSIPDQNTIWRFRLLLEHRGLGRQLFNTISQQLKAAGLKLSLGTIVDASIVSAPSWMHRKDLS